MVIVLAKDQFTDALPDDDMRLRIRQSRPPSLRQALETALELESYSLASRRAKPVREVHLEKGSHGYQQSGATDAETNVLQQLEECVRALQRCQQRKTKFQKKQKKVGGQSTGKDAGCWGCGQPGHFQRDCPHAMQQANKSSGGDDSAASVQDQGNEK